MTNYLVTDDHNGHIGAYDKLDGDDGCNHPASVVSGDDLVNRLISEASTLRILRDALNDVEYSDGRDWSSLPTFGGDEPEDTTGIWSWDEDAFLLWDEARGWYLADREGSDE